MLVKAHCPLTQNNAFVSEAEQYMNKEYWDFVELIKNLHSNTLMQYWNTFRMSDTAGKPSNTAGKLRGVKSAQSSLLNIKRYRAYAKYKTLDL